MRRLLPFLFPVMASCFPDHLQGPVGCSTELDISEIIMNNKVVAYEESKEPEIEVAVKGKDGVILKSPLAISSVPITFDMIVLNPKSVPDVQYVIDTTEGAKFEFGTCDGNRRATGRAEGATGTSNKLIIEQLPEKPIRVWAGWANGHTAVTLTNVFVMEKDIPAEPAIENIVEEVKELEKADEKEREQVQKDLGDDDATNVGDLELQLEKMHADPDLKARMEKIFDKRAQFKDKRGFHLPDVDKYKDLIQDKDKLEKTNLNRNWDEVKKRLAMDPKFDMKQGQLEKMAEHKRIMMERRQKMMKERPEGTSNKLKDLAHRDDRWKERLQEKREMLQAKQKAPADDADETPEDELPFKQRVRELYEEQESDIAIKEFLIGLLGVLVANWLVLQICLWHDKKQKGRRDL